jgi:putrescine transport system permease protein
MPALRLMSDGAITTRNRMPLLAVLPLVWLLLFFAAPFVIVAVVSLGAQAPDDVPPVSLGASLRNYLFLASDSLYVTAWLNSLRIAAIGTVLTLLLGYPMAYAISRAPRRWQPSLLLMMILPFWTSFLIRIYAWMGILSENGLLNNLLRLLGIEATGSIIGTEPAIWLGIVYAYLPFMVLPLYATLERQDPALLEAAGDLGARPLGSFLAVTLPLSLPGIVAGCLLVFIPAVGEFIIPDLLGGTETLMVGKVLWSEFFSNSDWPLASAVAVLLLVVLVLPIVLFQRAEARALAQG